MASWLMSPTLNIFVCEKGDTIETTSIGFLWELNKCLQSLRNCVWYRVSTLWEKNSIPLIYMLRINSWQTKAVLQEFRKIALK